MHARVVVCVFIKVRLYETISFKISKSIVDTFIYNSRVPPRSLSVLTK